MLNKIFGGRPMRCNGFAFTDIVSGRDVYYWVDKLGRGWLAENAWSRFRISTSHASQAATDAEKGQNHG